MGRGPAPGATSEPTPPSDPVHWRIARSSLTLLRIYAPRVAPMVRVRCSRPRRRRGPARRRWAGWIAGLAGLVAVAMPAVAGAAPGVASRLGGIEPAGPASRSVTGLHHNPAMLAAMRSTSLHASFSLGVEQLRVRRNAIDPATGEPTSALDDPTNVLNGGVGYFLGGSLYLDPWAVGLGIYDVGSRYRLASADPLRFHLAPDPDVGCLDVSLRRCPPNGGEVNYRHDLTVALAYNGGIFQVGAAGHFPMVRERMAFDNDTELQPPPGSDVTTVRCDDKEAAACAERVGFKGWTHWIPRDGAPPGFDFAITLGAAVSLSGDKITLGARYRTFPLRRGGEVLLGGVALVCRPDPPTGASQVEDRVPPCATAQPVGATLRERLPQELGLGGSFILGPSRLWRVDTNVYWADLCPGGRRPGDCHDDGNQTVRLVGLDRARVVLPEYTRFRGLTDVLGADVFARYRAKTNIYLLFAGHFNSPGVRRAATTAATNDGWRLGGSVGARVRVRRTDLMLVPGYGLDFDLPRRVAPGSASFDPAAATAFVSSGGDLNAPGADLVLLGRGRPSNAGRYFSMTHTLSIAVLWGERSGALD